jgi:hypothetical protein
LGLDLLPWEVDAALNKPAKRLTKRQIYRQAYLAREQRDERIRQELAAREAADAEARLMRRPILDAFRSHL